MNPINQLNNQQLEQSLKNLVSQERKLLSKVLDYIREVDSRKLYLERAYSSLFEYLVKELGYSSSAAMRRMEAARLLTQVPHLVLKIQDGSINLSQLGEVARALKQLPSGQTLSENEKALLIDEISGQSIPETQKRLARKLNLPALFHDKERTQGDSSVRLEITLTQEQYQLLKQARDRASTTLLHHGKKTNWSSVIEFLCHTYIKTLNRPQSLAKRTLKNPTSLGASGRKSVSKNQKQEIRTRDLYCQYKDPLSRRICGSTFNLQIDHKVPRWASRANSLSDLHENSNLQILCGVHNRYKYSKESGFY